MMRNKLKEELINKDIEIDDLNSKIGQVSTA